MIWESGYWKDDLLKLRDFLKGASTKRHWTERSLVDLEKRVFIAFYSIRKLIEAKKLSDRIVRQCVAVREYPSVGKPVTLLNWHKVEVLYKWEEGAETTKPLKFVCDQVVHSYVFVPVFNARGGLASLLFASDWQRNRSILELQLREFSRLLKEIGTDYPCQSHMEFDPKIQDYIVRNL